MILAHEVNGLLCLMAASLIYLFLSPRMEGRRLNRSMLLSGLLVLSFFYYIAMEPSPALYVVYSIPLCLTFALMYEGTLPAVVTWILFNIGNFVLDVNEAYAAGAASFVLAAAGWLAGERGWLAERLSHKLMRTIAMLTLYFGLYRLLGANPELSAGELLLAVTGTYLAAAALTVVTHLVANQQRQQEEQLNIEKYQMVGQLAASISHEVRNPLTSALGFLQLLNKRELSAEQFELYRDQAIKGIEQANHVVTDYLHFAKPAVDEIRQLDAVQEIENIKPWAIPLAEQSGIEFRIDHHSEGVLPILGDSRKLQQCLYNIIKNAVEAMPNGGRLLIETWRDDSGSVGIRIKDTGIGMTDKELARIGLPFFTTKEKGTGLGLMVVISLIRAMNGRLTIRSRPGLGTECLLKFQTR
ncbi:sensor histidine kinase [Paenibacillus sambharensis]|uniref:histidine kinase n=1 Tax=Paenibacillus sambharensis TaxID=1803190 RepID=A0A2W1LS59_9BACL|nr:ATP-binding protein [Paenibacillus sambharensis]PZD94287.1 sensor histidine kinase [Paenibacillus sambharensis]